MAAAGAAAAAVGGDVFGAGNGGPNNGNAGTGFNGPNNGPVDAAFASGNTGGFNSGNFGSNVSGFGSNANGTGFGANANNTGFGANNGNGFGANGAVFGANGTGFGANGAGFGANGTGFGADFGFGFGANGAGFGPGGTGFGADFGFGFGGQSGFGFGLGNTTNFFDPFFDPNFFDQTSQVTTTFTVLNATTGNDTLIGGDTADQFVMEYGVSMGGVDSVNGGLGTDEIAFTNLNDTLLVYDPVNTIADYSDSTGTVSGSAILTSVEQIYTNDGFETFTDASGTSVQIGTNGVRLAFSSTDTGTGYIMAGTSSGDTLNLADGTALNYGSGILTNTVTNGSVMGSIIFGKGGNDTITGTSSGDIIFGGTGNDTINGGGSSSADGDVLFGGDGNDTFNMTSATGSSTFVGGAGTDSVSYAGYSVATITAVIGVSSIGVSRGAQSDSLSSIETLTGSSTLANTFNFSGDSTALGLTTVTGGGASDVFSISSGATVTAALDGGAGTDTLVISNSTSNTLTVSNLESISGGTGNDTITLGAAQTSGSINLGAGTDSLTLANGTNILTVSNTETITGGTGADTITLSGVTGETITGGLGADNITSGGGADIFVFTSSSDGAAAGANSGYDVIQGFTSGTDKIALGGALRTAIDDITADGSLAWVMDNNASNGAAVTVNFTSTDEALMITTANAINSILLNEANFTTVLAAINNNNITSAAGDDALIAVQASNGATAFYSYLEDGVAVNSVSASELSMLSSAVTVTVADTDVSLV